jgi:hypothetical protein
MSNEPLDYHDLNMIRYPCRLVRQDLVRETRSHSPHPSSLEHISYLAIRACRQGRRLRYTVYPISTEYEQPTSFALVLNHI